MGKHYSPQTEFKKGQIPWNKKLTDKQEQEIKLKHSQGQSQRSLAREYNIDQTSIKRVTSK